MECLEPILRPADVASILLLVYICIQYIGSFLVSGKDHHERAEIVRQKLEAARVSWKNLFNGREFLIT